MLKSHESCRAMSVLHKHQHWRRNEKENNFLYFLRDHSYREFHFLFFLSIFLLNINRVCWYSRQLRILSKNVNQIFSIYRLSSTDYNNLIIITFFSDEDNRFDAMVIFRNSKYLNIKNNILYLYYPNNLQSSIEAQRKFKVLYKSCTYSQRKISQYKFHRIKTEKKCKK